MTERVVKVAYGGRHSITLEFERAEVIYDETGAVFTLFAGVGDNEVHIVTFVYSKPLTGGLNMLVFHLKDRRGWPYNAGLSLPQTVARKLYQQLISVAEHK